MVAGECGGRGEPEIRNDTKGIESEAAPAEEAYSP